MRAGRGAYRAVAASFLIHSTVSGTWAPRLPAIKESLDLSDGELGTALVGLAIGLVVGTRLAGVPVDRFGSRPMMRAGFPLLAGTLLLPGLAQSGTTLFAALLVLGIASGALDVAMNAQGIEVERRLGRPILSGLHGLWSVGLGIGAGVAAIAAAIDAGPLEHFAVVAAVLAVASLVFLRGLLPADRLRAADGSEEPRIHVPWTPALVLLGVIAFCSFVGEGAASDWSAVYLTQELDSSPALGAVAFAAFAVTMAIARFAADPLRTKLGNVVLVRGGSLTAAVGLGVALLVHEPAAGIIGFALLGLGLAPVVPIAFSAAGDLDPRATGVLVGRVATIGYVGSVAGPIMIGWLAEFTSLRASLGLVVLLAIVIAISARPCAAARTINRPLPAEI
ncbi:MAG TPA: MFS transporter [Thermoleophilaceae bacterium]|nr:MFS transporter [Thermoleophilaceae bacterium]